MRSEGRATESSALLQDLSYIMVELPDSFEGVESCLDFLFCIHRLLLL